MTRRKDDPSLREEAGSAARAQLGADDPSGAGTTIVGGQPDVRRKRKADLPVGVEKVLYLAASDPDFRRAFFADREAAIEARGLRLRPSELAVLKLAPADQLALAIDNMDVSEAAIERRDFMRAVAAAAVTIAAGEVMSGCQTEGIRPDYDDGADAARRDGGDIEAGIRPDIEGHDAEADAADATAQPAGIRPDYDGGED